MKIIRGLISIVLFGIGVLLLLFGLFYALGSGIDETAIKHNRQLEATFKQAANYVLSYQAQSGRLPTSDAFTSWANEHPSVPYTSPHGMSLHVQEYPEEAIKEFGAAPPNAFLLVYWRGEWFEYYASWVNRSSLVFEPSRYYVLGSKYADGLVVILVAVVLLILARRLFDFRCKESPLPTTKGNH